MITLDGKTLKELGLVPLKNHLHPILSASQDLTVEIPNMHGAYPFPSKLGPKTFNFPLLISEENRQNVQRIARKLAAFLLDVYGRPRDIKLVFDYEKDKYYTVRYSGQIDIERYIRLGNFPLPFTAYDPHAYFLYKSDEITWDTDIPILSDISMDTGSNKFEVTNNQTIKLINDGSLVVRPTFIIEGSAASLTLAMNGKSFSLPTFTGVKYEINGEKYTILKDGISNFADKQGKDWLELLPGINDLSVTGTDLNTNLTISYRYKYM